MADEIRGEIGGEIRGEIGGENRGVKVLPAKYISRAIKVLVLFVVITSSVAVSLYSYVGFMAADLTGGTVDDAGYTAGLMASANYLGKFFMSFLWGYVADIVGRKPVMIISLVSVIVFPVAFGLSKSLAWAVMTRLLMGMTCPAQVVIRMVVPEVAGSSYVVEATGYISGAISFAMTVGPAVGGWLAQPAKHFPTVFSSDGLFARYPYLLPNLVAVPFSIICIILTVLFVPETKTDRKGFWKQLRRSKSLDGKRHEGLGYHKMNTQALDAAAELTPVRARKRSFEGENGQLHPGGLNHDVSRESPSIWYSSRFVSPLRHRPQVSPAHSRPHVSPAHTRLPVSPGCGESNVEQENIVQPSHKPLEASATSAGFAKSSTTPGGTGSAAADDNDKGEANLLQLHYVAAVVCASGLMEVILTSFDEMYPLWAISSRRAGGLNWDMMVVGQVFFVAGIINTLFMLFGYSWLSERSRLATTHRTAGIMAVVPSTAIPFMGYLDWSDPATFLISCLVVAVVNSASYMLYNVLIMASTNQVPPHLRGKVAGLASASMGLGGAVGPFAFSVMFAWSISTTSTAGETSLVNQHFTFVVAGVLRVLVLSLLWNVLGNDALTEVMVDDSPSLKNLPSMELDSICEDDVPDSPETLVVAGHRASLV